MIDFYLVISEMNRWNVYLFCILFSELTIYDYRNHNHLQQNKIDGMYIYFVFYCIHYVFYLKQQDINLSYTIFF